jgi:alginate O-acetyltransferase complex protein AlgI
LDSASIQFVLFGLATAVTMNLSRSPNWRSTVLLCASATFLVLVATAIPDLIPLFGFLGLGYAATYLLGRGFITSLVWVLVVIVASYMWLKQYIIFPSATFIAYPYLTLGLSYVFFRVVHLAIEAREQDGVKDVSLGAYLLYNINFTTFVSGPIQRYSEFARDMFAAEPIPLGYREIGIAVERLVLGFFKVSVLAMVLDMAHTDALSRLQHPTSNLSAPGFACLLATVYPFFLYANFSGYIDVVIALSRLMRIRLPENFDRPFSASSFLDFWNRWHITLSTWLKTYVFNTLLVALMRSNPSPSLAPIFGVICFFVTFFLIGIWHGRTSEFILFGVLQGGGVAVNKLWQIVLTAVLGGKGYKALAKNRIYVAFGRGLTFSWFAFTLFWFWASWGQLGAIFGSLTSAQWLGVWLTIWLAATTFLEAWEVFRAWLYSVRISGDRLVEDRHVRVVAATALAVVSLFVVVLLQQPAPNIVYRSF